MNKPPKVIYLQCFDEDGEYLSPKQHEVTWCTDQIGDNDAEYCLATRGWMPSKQDVKVWLYRMARQEVNDDE